MSIQNLAERLGPLDEMRNTQAARHFTLGVWRALRDDGMPLDQTALAQISSDAGLGSAEYSALVERYAELDNHGALIGLSGLFGLDLKTG